MIVVSFRSSSFNQWSYCPHAMYLRYTLGLPEPANRKAILGSMTHKALECMARKKLALQRGESTFTDPESKRVFDVSSFSPEDGVQLGYDIYREQEAHIEWNDKDLRQVRKLTNETLTMSQGQWNPMNMEVVQPEQYFDFVIEKDWARYAYTLPDGQKLEGYLGLKGTVDLITKEDDKTLHYVDWKTGKRKDWATGKEKDWKSLRDDPQMRIYHYALTRLYPEYPFILFTVNYVADGGPYTLDFGPKDIPRTEAMLKERFEIIRNCVRPPRILHDRQHNWKCSKLCHFGKNNFLEQGKDSGQTICEYMHREVLTLGIDRATAKHRVGAIGAYVGGGGMSNREGVDK